MRYFCLVVLFLISSLVFAEDESKEISRRDILNMMKTNIDYSYESHVDIAYDLYAQNKHVNRRLSEDEQAKYYKNPLVYMTEVAQTDWQRAFEMSMYYQGWKPNTIFYRFDFFLKYDGFLIIPSTDDMRFKERKVLDKEKALHWAEISYDLYSKEKSKDFKFLDKLCGNFELISDNLLYRLDESDCKDKNKKIESLIYGKTLSIYQKHSTIRYDLLPIEKLLFARYAFDFWRFYYCGFVYPKNKEFAILSITSNCDKSSDFNKDVKSEISLFKVLSGLYDKEDYNEKFLSISKRESIISRMLFFEKNFKDYQKGASYFDIIYASSLNKYSIEYLSLENFEYRDEFTIKNNLYNRQKALIEFENIFDDDSYNENLRDIWFFVRNAPRQGITEEVYNQLMPIIRKKFNEYFYKENEEYARKRFSEHIPDYYEYR